ncbi:MAG: rane-bound dehydrogenase domain protein, partial [Verrucomicrobiales bacterium]|nr:rane-bound dehydrogenase domain protein [Verrucomicrobiales bacterium]
MPVDVDITGAKKLWLVVTDGGNGYSCDWADWLEPKLIRANGSSVNLTSIKWKSATAGWGTVNLNKNVAGDPLRQVKRVYPNGIGTHAPSVIEYELPEAFSRFITKAALDAGGTEQNGEPQVEFKIYTEQPGADALYSNPGVGRQVGFDAAKESLKNFEVADGLEVSLFAAEPMVRNPTDMEIDERGRIWICEGANYRSTFQPWGTLDPKGDRIVILEDTNADGVADKETTFYQGPEINSALGICVLGDKVIVSRSPDVFLFTDTDGDGKADKKEVMFTGISGMDHDHGMHAFVFGPDGKLYFNFGNAGVQLKRADGSPVLDVEEREVSAKGKPFRNGMVFRCNLDGSEVEVLAHNFRNNYEMAVDSFGTVWQSDYADDGYRGVRIIYVMEHGAFGYSDELTGAAWPEQRTNIVEETA